MRSCLAPIFFLTLGFSLAAQGTMADTTEIDGLDQATLLSRSWRYSFSDDPSYSLPDFDDSAWDRIDMPHAALRLQGPVESFFWLRHSFSVHIDIRDRSLALYLGKLPAAVQVYVNGSLLLESGRAVPGRAYGASNIPRRLMIPAALLRPGRNVLAYRAMVISRSDSFVAPFIANDDSVGMRYALDFFCNSQMSIIASILSALTALYFLVLFLRDRRQGLNLLASLAFILLAVYFASVYTDVLGIPYTAACKIWFSCLYASIPCFIIFFQDFFGIHRIRPLRLAILASSLAAIAILLSSPGYRGFSSVNGRLFQLYLAPLLLYILAITVLALRRGKPYALAFLIGTLTSIAGGLTDMVFLSMSVQPAFWLTSWGLMGLILAVFFSSAAAGVDARRQSEQRGAELGTKQGKLETLVAGLRLLGEDVARSGEKLDGEIRLARVSVEGIVGTNERIRSGLAGQAHAAEESSRNLAAVLSSFGESTKLALRQAEASREASHTVETLMASIASVWDLTQKAQGISARLSERAESGQEMVVDSTQAMRNIEGASDEVRTIVDGIREIADKTNILAMNAAIEAAHAGDLGRGFAVVADEVRSLSERSAENASGINRQIDTMAQAIRAGSVLFEQLIGGFQAIMGGAKETVQLISEISRAGQAQKTDNQRIADSMLGLLEASTSLKKSAEEQKRQGESASLALLELEKAAKAIVEGLGQRSQDERDILDVLDRLSRISADNRDILSRLALHLGTA